MSYPSVPVYQPVLPSKMKAIARTKALLGKLRRRVLERGRPEWLVLGLCYPTHAISITLECLRDLDRRIRWLSFPDEFWILNSRGRALEAQTIKDQHRVEKGLALGHPRRPFGADLETRLQHCMKSQSIEPAGAGVDGPAALAPAALSALRSWNRGEDKLRETVAPITSVSLGASAFDSALSLFQSRHSIRDFTRGPVPDDTVRKALEIALTTPSVCNRQSWGLIAVSDPKLVQRTLNLQNGNAGFGHLAPLVLVVTVDLRLFTGAQERNQCWIDGGMFLMNVLMGIHAQGLGACALNWSAKNRESDELRSLLGIGSHSEIISLVAVGALPNQVRAATSPRRDMKEILREL